MLIEAAFFDKDRTLLVPNRRRMVKGVEVRAPRGRSVRYSAEGDVLEKDGVVYEGGSDTWWNFASRLRGGTSSFLQQLSEADIAIGMITLDLVKGANDWLEVAGIRHFFHENGIVGEDSIGLRSHKPNPEHFLTGARNLGVNPEKCVMIGDDLEADIIGAQAVGMKTVLVRYHRYPRREVRRVRPDIMVDSFNQLTIGMLDRLFV